MKSYFAGIIMWEIFNSEKEILNAFDTSTEQFSLRKAELLRTLRKIHSRGVTIVWMLIDPIRVTVLIAFIVYSKISETYEAIIM